MKFVPFVTALASSLTVCVSVSAETACEKAGKAAAPPVPLRLEAENGEMLPNVKGEKPGPYQQIPGVSGGAILAFFQQGKGVRYGKPPAAAKWVVACFGTNNGGKDAKVQFFDGERYLGEMVFPDTGDFHQLQDFQVARIEIPKDADLRIVAPELPVNIDYFDFYDTEQPPALPKPNIPRVEELRDKLFAGEYGTFDEIIFATRTHTPEHWYANFGYYCYDRSFTILNRQGRLAAYNLRTRSFRKILEDIAGSVRDPCVHYDGRTIVFSYRPGDQERYHLFTIQSDGTGLRQLTFGEYDDIEPAWLPDGDIVFVSARARRWVNCWLTQVATVYRMKPDGSDIRMLSSNIEHDNTPWPLHDGRVAYMRWEYVDRRQVTFHHLWTMNPDGTQHQILQGNTYPESVYIDAKPIPGSDDIVLIDSPGHGRTEHGGFLSVLSVKSGPDKRSNVRHISKGNKIWYDSWAFSPDLFMATDGDGVFLMNRRGETERLFGMPPEYTKFEGMMLGSRISEPRPLMPHKRERLLVDRTDLASKTGEFYLENVMISRSLQGVKPGTIKKLMIMESLPKPINYTGGMDPLTYGGSFTLTRQLGSVPVEEDGSAYFRVPALRPLFFIALDAEGRAVKRMQSFTQVMPGEKQGCVGCHERKTENTVHRVGTVSKALSRGPSEIDPSSLVFDVPDFPRDVQPVLDRSCVRCHNPDKRSGGVDLCGDRGPMFSLAYYNLIAHNQVYDGRNSSRSDWPPYERGSGGSPLMEKISGKHHGATVTPADRKVIMQWLDTSAPYPGTYGALGCGSIGGYRQNKQMVNTDTFRPATVAAQEVIRRRCDTCHTSAMRLPHAVSDENGISFWTPNWNDPRLTKWHRHMLFNLSRPEKSLFLKAPLAKEAGGLGMGKEGKSVFKSTEDADYKAILAMIQDGHDVLEKEKRFDMQGFRPPKPYLREMKRYGILPASFDLDKDPADPYILDRKYWALDWTQLK
ncbi:MAG: PD40 domain-containing protein [Kiritimatiellae bacterium]|nr:PD40 domain-containing protein [Kiritimatiellia bacterium]